MNDEEQLELTCVDCDDTFLYTVAEQKFRSEQGMAEPVRCPECRANRRAQRNSDLISERSSNRGDRKQKRQRRGNNQQNPQDRYPAICADCGENTMVPFMPRGDRPVYCRNCFNARRGR